MVWQGDFENQQRASQAVTQVVPIMFMLIFLFVFIMFAPEGCRAGIPNVPCAVVGGIFALLITGTISVSLQGSAFIALFGICILKGIGDHGF